MYRFFKSLISRKNIKKMSTVNKSSVDRDHFNKIYWFIVGCTTFVFAYILAITFLPIPEKSQRFVDISLGFLLLLSFSTCFCSDDFEELVLFLFLVDSAFCSGVF